MTNQQQGNFQHGDDQFANLSQFLSNQPKTFTSCDQPFDAEDWMCDMNKHFECSNVLPKDFVKFSTFQLKGQASIWWLLSFWRFVSRLSCRGQTSISARCLKSMTT